RTPLSSHTLSLPDALPISQLAGELGAFLHYAVTDEPPTAESIAAAAEVLARVDNAAGKLYLLIATPYWNAVSETLYRRQAQSNADRKSTRLNSSHVKISYA